MKSTSQARQPPQLPKLKLRQRTRTCSSDSGVEVGSETPCELLDETLFSWCGRLEGVIGQEVARARELTTWAKDALQHAEGDEDRREEIVESWRKQMEGVMEFTSDLIECVNNDTKDNIAEALGTTSSPLQTSLTIEEKEEEEKEEEIMKLFWTPCTLPPPSKSSKKRLRQSKKPKNNTLTKAQLEPLKSKSEVLEEQEDKNHSKGYHIFKGLKMLQSTLDSEDIFDDWNWNLTENEMVEDIFAEWIWNLDMKVDLKQKFYDDPMTENAWNDFHFWNFNKPVLTDLMALNMLVPDDVESARGLSPDSLPDSGCDSWRQEENPNWLRLDGTPGDLRRPSSGTSWMDCKYWEESYQNESILQSLLDGEIQDNTSSIPVNFWDESASNQATIELLMKHEEMEKESKFLWEDKEIIFALAAKAQAVQYFPWEDPDTFAKLMEESRPTRRASDDSNFLWDDPAAIGLLLTDEEEESGQPWDDKTDMTEELLSNQEEDRKKVAGKKRVEEHPPQHTTWEQWSLWDQFGSSREIIQAYEEAIPPQPANNRLLQVNIDEAFWDITMAKNNGEVAQLQSASIYNPEVYSDTIAWDTEEFTKKKASNQQKDPINTFKAFRHIFNETSSFNSNKYNHTKEKPLYDDMLDIYSEWAPNVLADERMEKKRQRRGRGNARVQRPQQVPSSPPAGTVRRPGTPTVTTNKGKGWELEAGWIQSKYPRNERKSSQGWRTGRRQRQLHAKIHAKQPRTLNAAYQA